MSTEIRRAPSEGRERWWLLLLALPVLGLALLLAEPQLDVQWEHHPSHFWLVLLTAGVNVVLAYFTNLVASRYRDARVVLISLAFLASAGFLGLHALATPGVLLPAPNAGFTVATPVGLFVASLFAVASASPLAGPRAAIVLRGRSTLLGGLVALMVLWGVISLARLPPLDGPPPTAEGPGLITVLAIVSVALYALSAWRCIRLYRDRGGLVLLTIAIALVLLAEAMIAVALSRNWHASWWEWHLLMLAAFAAIGLGARREYRRSGSLTAAFGGIYLEATLARIDRWYAHAIAAVAEADERGESTERVLAGLRREGASTDEVKLLAHAAGELRRLDASFRPYLPSVIAERIRQEPDIARLGGEEREVSILFADLAAFTTFSETRSPTEVITMLNEYWADVVPVIELGGGVIEQFAGDGVMAVYNVAGDQPDHAERASRAGLEIIAAGQSVAAVHPAWPIFRVGVNSGRAVVGNVGAEGRRSFAVISDVTNVASRLLAIGQPGQVIVARTTWEALGPGRDGIALGPTLVKGKREPIEAWVLRALRPG
jgi:class 3 adenylate cyclase